MSDDTSQPDKPGRPESPLDCRDFLLAALVAAAALAAYLATLPPEWMDSDCAEFYTQAVMLGYAHPTGYPVYLLLAKLATLAPLGQVPYRVNLLSAVMGATAAGLAYLAGRLLTGRRWAAVAGAVALAVSPTFWSQAIIAKVYTTGLVFMLAVICCLVLWRRTGRARWLFIAAATGGASLGVHVTHSLLAPAALLLVLSVRQRWKTNLAAAAGGAVCGAALTLAAYWTIDRIDSPTSYFRAVIEPSRSEFGLQQRELSTFAGRLKLCLEPPQYTELLLSKPAGVIEEKAQWYLGNLQHEFPLPWLGLSLLGMYGLCRRDWRLALLLVLTGATHFAYDLIYDMGGIHVLYLATYVPLVLLATAGLSLLAGKKGTSLISAGQEGEAIRGKSVMSPFSDALAGLLGLAIVCWPLCAARAWNVEHRRDCWVPPGEDPFLLGQSPKLHEDARRLVRDLEPDAILFTGWCPLYAYYYVAYVEQPDGKPRRDLQFIQDYPRAYHFQLADSALDYVKAMAPTRPVYFTHVVEKVNAVFELTPVKRGGQTLYRVGKGKRPP